MPHLHRFYITPETPSEAAMTLPPEEAHHALRVARVREGEAVALIDGRGRELRGAVCETTRRGVTVAVEEERFHEAPAVQLTLLQAWLARDKTLDGVVRRGTELGAATFCFFQAARSGQPPRIPERWRRIALETCKQCGRFWMPEFETAPGLAQALAAASKPLLAATMDRPAAPLRHVLAARPNAVSVAIGPEGDFTPEELDMLDQHGAAPITLGPATFRSEAAAPLAAALILYELGQLGPLP